MSAQTTNIAAWIKDGEIGLDGDGTRVDLISLADVVLYAAASRTNAACSCFGCVAIRRLSRDVGDVLRHFGRAPIRSDPARRGEAPASPPRAH